MRIDRTVTRDPGPTVKFGKQVYRYQCAFSHQSDAERTVREWRQQGLFVKVIKHQKRGHPVGHPKLKYRPSYLVYIRPKVTKQPSWYRAGSGGR